MHLNEPVVPHLILSSDLQVCGKCAKITSKMPLSMQALMCPTRQRLDVVTSRYWFLKLQHWDLTALDIQYMSVVHPQIPHALVLQPLRCDHTLRQLLLCAAEPDLPGTAAGLH